MTPADSFHRAVSDGDFSAAEAALTQYLHDAGSPPGGIAEVAAIRDFLTAALHAVESRRSDLARELARLGRLEQGYCRRPAASTWDLEA